MPQYSGGPYRTRTWLRSHLPWFLINLGIASKGKDCEAAGGQHEWYNSDEKNSNCYHCEVCRPGQFWKKENIPHGVVLAALNMKPDETLDISEKILERIDRSIFKAISLAALFGRAANQGDDLRPHFDNSSAAAGYNTVMDSLYFELVLTVARLFDGEKRDAIVPTTASVPVVVSLLEEPGVLDALRERKRRRHDPEEVTGMDDSTKSEYRKRIFGRIDQEIVELPPLLEQLRNLKGHKLLRSIRSARNDFMAHTAIAPSRDILTYGQAEALLAVAEPLLTALQYLIRSYHPDYRDEAERQSALADEFWKRASCQTRSQQPPA